MVLKTLYRKIQDGDWDTDADWERSVNWGPCWDAGNTLGWGKAPGRAEVRFPEPLAHGRLLHATIYWKSTWAAAHQASTPQACQFPALQACRPTTLPGPIPQACWATTPPGCHPTGLTGRCPADLPCTLPIGLTSCCPVRQCPLAHQATTQQARQAPATHPLPTTTGLQ
jgi:hypothetical protein